MPAGRGAWPASDRAFLYRHRDLLEKVQAAGVQAACGRRSFLTGQQGLFAS